MTRTEFLREQTISGANKCKRAPFTYTSVADEPCSLPERKALALKYLFDNMPVYIGEQELIVGTRTLFPPNRGNEDGRDIHAYGLATRIPYVNEAEKELFGYVKSYDNKTHFTPDFEIPYHTDIMEKLNGIDLDAARRVAGNGFYYLMGDIARIHSAVTSYARDFMIDKGFTYCIPPFMIRSNVVTGVMSFAEMEAMMYKIEGEDLYLIGTSEHSMIGKFQGKIVEKDGKRCGLLIEDKIDAIAQENQ